MEQFRKEDFIRLKNPMKYNINRIIGANINILKILSIENNYIKVVSCDEDIPVYEIEPITINGKDDFQIYYKPTNVCASYVMNPNDYIPVSKTDYSYYYDTFKNHFYNDKNFQELIKEREIHYVHEVQHYLADVLNDQGLRFDEY